MVPTAPTAWRSLTCALAGDSFSLASSIIGSSELSSEGPVEAVP